MLQTWHRGISRVLRHEYTCMYTCCLNHIDCRDVTAPLLGRRTFTEPTRHTSTQTSTLAQNAGCRLPCPAATNYLGLLT